MSITNDFLVRDSIAGRPPAMPCTSWPLFGIAVGLLLLIGLESHSRDAKRDALLSEMEIVAGLLEISLGEPAEEGAPPHVLRCAGSPFPARSC